MGAEEVGGEVQLREARALQLDEDEELVGDSAGARHRRRNALGEMEGAGARKEASISSPSRVLADVEWGRHGSAMVDMDIRTGSQRHGRWVRKLAWPTGQLLMW